MRAPQPLCLISMIVEMADRRHNNGREVFDLQSSSCDRPSASHRSRVHHSSQDESDLGTRTLFRRGIGAFNHTYKFTMKAYKGFLSQANETHFCTFYTCRSDMHRSHPQALFKYFFCTKVDHKPKISFEG